MFLEALVILDVDKIALFLSILVYLSMSKRKATNK